MELEQVRVFVAVAEELHFGRAAERLHMAQPPVSRLVQRLERDLGTALFDRTTRAVRLTAAGRALLPVAEEILQSVQRARSVVEATSSGQLGRVQIAFAGASTHRRLAQLACAVRVHRPGIDLQLFSANYAAAALEKVLRRDMDLALGRWPHFPDTIANRRIASERLVVAMPAGHSLAGYSRIPGSALRGESFVTLPQLSGSVTTEALSRLAREAGFMPSIVQVASDTWTLLTLVSAGVGVAVTVSSVMDGTERPDLVFVELSDHYEPIYLSVAWRRGESDPAICAVLELSEEVLPTIEPDE